MHVKKGMEVRVVCGNHKGLEGKVLNVFPKKQKSKPIGRALDTSSSFKLIGVPV